MASIRQYNADYEILIKNAKKKYINLVNDIAKKEVYIGHNNIMNALYTQSIMIMAVIGELEYYQDQASSVDEQLALVLKTLLKDIC